MDEKIPTYTPVPPIAGIESSEKAYQTKPKEYYFEVVYWTNGTKAKESKFELTEYGNRAMNEEKYWDENGKLISEINFKNIPKDKKYLQIEYYTRNNFAVQLKQKRELSNQEFDGISTYYNADGKIQKTVKYIHGTISEETSFENGKSTMSYYQNGEPYEGIFTNVSSDKLTTYTLVKGKKEGKVITQNTKTNTLFAQGIYKNGLPIEGSFYFDEEPVKLLQYKNGKQEGIQKEFTNWNDELKEEYEMKAGKRNGFRKIYEDGKLKYESVYKNDEIFSGKIWEGEDELTYVDGQLMERIVLGSDYDRGISIIEKFENGEISSVEYFNFTIKEKPQESYKGKYKNGNPFHGYFANQIIVDKIYLIDYFENGKIKYQYSFDILEQLEGYRHYIYNHKAEFENGKVLNGAEFIPPTKNGFLKINYKNGVADALEINLFAMHYFNRINQSAMRMKFW
ncbi:toxin-antitoxin system YwqK family antitoxin [Niabella ginsengisoli]|uniref:Toxin-antitoxin system YwqK family antitoxin n=1 Tax=Niabella ginsengisoli TaxID=522298 RepID=A0ABS9SLD2_9BACT|nr:hypothetical protein [Niabella ginsengisoli]MCH5599191.1 hypothetical protein [Niabella ginsengisoli]